MNDAGKNLEETLVTHVLQHYKNHCEFLGYSVQEESESCIVCRHSRKDSFRLFLLRQNIGIMAQVIYALPKKLGHDPTLLYMYANELNIRLTFMKVLIRVYEDGAPFIFLNSVLEGEYDRRNFSIFLDNIAEDMDLFHSYPKTISIWQSEDEAND